MVAKKRPTPRPARDATASDLAALAARIDRALRAEGAPERAVQEKRYLKSALVHYGASVPAIRRVALGALREGPALGRKEVLALADLLWRSGAHEPRMAAVEILGARVDVLRAGDLRVMERYLREARTWALVDGLAAECVGALVARFSSLQPSIERWAKDEDFWLRRSALLAYLLPMRRGEPVFDRFAALAEPMLEDKEFFIRKAIGWVLRERSKRRPDEVYGWLLPRAARASGLTLREASKHLDPAQQKALLKAAAAKGC